VKKSSRVGKYTKFLNRPSYLIILFKDFFIPLYINQLYPALQGSILISGAPWDLFLIILYCSAVFNPKKKLPLGHKKCCCLLFRTGFS